MHISLLGFDFAIVFFKKERDWNALLLALLMINLEALDLWEKLNLYMAASRRNLEEHERESKRRKGPRGNFGGAFGQAGTGFEAEIEVMHMSWNTYSIQT